MAISRGFGLHSFSFLSSPAAQRRKRAESTSAIQEAVGHEQAQPVEHIASEFDGLPSASDMPITLELSPSNLEAKKAKSFVGRLKAAINSLVATIKNNPFAAGTIISLSTLGVLTGVLIGLSILVPPVGLFTAAALAAVAKFVGISGVALLSAKAAAAIGSAMFGVAALLADGFLAGVAKGISLIVNVVKLHRDIKALDLGKTMFVPIVDAVLPLAPAIAPVAGVNPGAAQELGRTVDLTPTVRFHPAPALTVSAVTQPVVAAAARDELTAKFNM